MDRPLTAAELAMMREKLSDIGDYMADRDFDSAEETIEEIYAVLGVTPPNTGSRLKHLTAAYTKGRI